MAAHNEIAWIYHERQESALCARHCLNNLLQGPFFTEFDLSNIAQALDNEERELVSGGGDDEMIKWIKENGESQNVGMDGNFSVQVIRQALANLHLELLDLGSKEATEAAEHPEREEAFICNLDAHWFAIRKVSNVWYNLNSLSGLPDTSAKPNVISDFFLSAFLSSLRNDGYSIFVVKGKFPIPEVDHYVGEKANWYKASELKSYYDTYPKELQKQVNQSRAGHAVLEGPSSNTEESMINKAIQQSLDRTESTGEMLDNDMELALAMSMSHANDKPKTTSTTTTTTENNSTKSREQAEDEEELSKAMLMSLQSEFESKVPVEPDNTVDPSKICEIRLCLPNGQFLMRKFLKENTIGDVIHFVKAQTTYHGDLELICSPATVFKEECKKLGDLPELGGKAKLIVKAK